MPPGYPAPFTGKSVTLGDVKAMAVKFAAQQKAEQQEQKDTGALLRALGIHMARRRRRDQSLEPDAEASPSRGPAPPPEAVPDPPAAVPDLYPTYDRMWEGAEFRQVLPNGS